MNMAINQYEARVWDKDGNAVHIGPVRASNRKDAARAMRCDIKDVKIEKENLPISWDEIASNIYASQHPAFFNGNIASARNNFQRGDAYKAKKKPKRKKR